MLLECIEKHIHYSGLVSSRFLAIGLLFLLVFNLEYFKNMTLTRRNMIWKITLCLWSEIGLKVVTTESNCSTFLFGCAAMTIALAFIFIYARSA